MTNKETLDLSVALGIGVKSHSSSIEEAQADRVRRRAERDGLIRPEQPEEAKPAKAAAKTTKKAAAKAEEPAAVAVAEPEVRARAGRRDRAGGDDPGARRASRARPHPRGGRARGDRTGRGARSRASSRAQPSARAERVPVPAASPRGAPARDQRPARATAGTERARPVERPLRRDRQPLRSARPHPHLLSARLLPVRPPRAALL